MRQILVFILLCLAFLPDLNAAPVSIVGSVTDKEDGRPVELANVTVRDDDRKIIAVCATDSNGKFSLNVHKTGKYTISITCIGYETWEEPLECQENADLGQIRLKPSQESIAGAVVTSRTLIRRESDRIVYDVLEDPDAGRLDMAVFMSKIPGLKKSVRDGDLEYKGRSVTRILIDDKTNPMINEGRQYPMDFIRADYMSKIELVLPGSPEYDNSEPLLVISLSRPLPYGAASQIRASASTRNEYDGTIDAVANTPIVGIGVKYGYGYTHNPADIRLNERVSGMDGAEPADRLESYSESRDEVQSHSLGLNLFRSVLRDKVDLAISLDAGRSETHSAALSRVVSTTSGEGVTGSVSPDGSGTGSPVSMSGSSLSPFRLNGGFSAGYSWSRGNELELKYTFRQSESSSDQIFENEGAAGTGTRNTSFRSSAEHNVSANLRMRIVKRFSFKAELGYMHRKYYNVSSYGTAGTGGMDYIQGVAYADGIFLGSFLDRRLGCSLILHLENVNDKGVNLASGSPLDYNEFNVIPRLSLSWRAWKNGSLGFSYTVRSRRPRNEMLDPYVDMTDPYNLKAGNPDLRGEISHDMSLSASHDFDADWLDFTSLSVSYSVTPGAIERVSYIDGDNVMTTTYENLASKDALGMKLSARFNITDRINLDLDAGASRNSYRFSQEAENIYWSFSGSEAINFNLKYFTVSQHFFLSPVMSAQTRDLWMEPVLGIGIYRYWEKIRLRTSIDCGDLLYGRSFRRNVTAGDGFVNTSSIMRQGRYVQFSLSWTIGRFRNTPYVKHTSFDLD